MSDYKLSAVEHEVTHQTVQQNDLNRMVAHKGYAECYRNPLVPA